MISLSRLARGVLLAAAAFAILASPLAEAKPTARSAPPASSHSSSGYSAPRSTPPSSIAPRSSGGYGAPGSSSG
ncbi:MAG: hypothetical protein WCC64_05065, partial [Aliidongia sp.]